MWWLISVVIMIFVTSVSVTQSHHLSSRRVTEVSTQQQAIQTVAYLNAINDYLYSHPMTDGTIPDDALPVKAPPGVKNLIQATRVYVWQPNTKGLFWQLEKASDSSALIGLVTNGRMQDALGTDMGVSVPPQVPDGDIACLN